MIFYLAAALLVSFSISYWLYSKITRKYINDNMQLIFVFFAIFPFVCAVLSMLTIPTIKQRIETYNKTVSEINIIESFDCDLSNQVFIDYLHSFIDMEKWLKETKENNKSVWIGIYIPNEIDDVKLVGQNIILNKCKETKPIYIENCEPTN